MDSVSQPMARPRRLRKQMISSGRLTSWAIWSIVLCGVIREALGQTFVVSFGFYSFHIIDPPVVLAMLATFFNIVNRPFAKSSYTIPILIISALIFINFARGMMTDSAQALLWFRGTAAIAAFLLLSLTAEQALAYRSMRNSIRVGALLLTGLLLLRIPFGYSFLMTIAQEDGGLINEGRLLSVVGAFLLLLALTISLSQLIRDGRHRISYDLVLSVALPVAIVMTGQGTVIIAMVTSIALVFILERGPLHVLRVIVGVGGGALILLGKTALPAFQSLGADDAYLTQRAGNLQTRQIVWSGLMDSWPKLSTSDQLFGLPGGQKPEIFVNINHNYAAWISSIHSMYYGSLPIMGYVGLMAYIALLSILVLVTFSKLVGSAGRRYFPASALACCVITAVLSYSYEIRNEEVLGIFWAILLLRGSNLMAYKRGVTAGQSATLSPI